MLISEVINSLEKIKEKFGDQKLFMWVNSNDDTLFPVNFPELDIVEISGKDYGIDEKWLNQNEKILIIKNLDNDSFIEDKDSIYKYEVETNELNWDKEENPNLIISSALL